ncbi:PAS domain S-box protein [Halorubellus sp. PRR65]|uniref:PAS domain S-box protein n=1 Tax=Halorubellus sp. PRR65 TaxID=3098148 RepID=UPI002B25CF08|nr:PAS domain S-box protein [Halorubellus sp. PRR65]
MASDPDRRGGGPRVLYVDGSPNVPTVTSALSADVTVVETAAAARDALAATRFDAVVTEYALPDATPADGGAISLCEHVRERVPETPVVVYTAHGNERVAGEVVAAGADAYVTKAEDVSVLAERVAELVGDDAAADSVPAEPEVVVEDAPLALVEVDTDDVIVRWNRGAEALFGYTKAEAIGEHLVELVVPPDERDDVEPVCETALGTPGRLTNVNENVRKDGTRITCEWHSTNATNADGDVRSSVSLVHDVTEREQRKETIAQLRSVTRDLVRADDAGTVAETVVTAVAEILGQPYSAVYLADDDDDGEVLRATAATAEFGTPPPVVTGESVNWSVYETGERRVIHADVPSATTLGDDTPVRSAVVHPLGDHGTLALGATEEHAFDETDVQLSTILASATTAAFDRTSREAELRFQQTIVDTVGAGVFALDSDGYVETVNDTLTKMTGYDREALVGMHASTLIGEEMYGHATEQMAALAAADDDGAGVVTLELQIRAADGTQVPCEANVGVLPGGVEDGGVAGVVRDVRERKRIQSELGDKRRKIENLHEVASLLDDCETRADVWRLTVEAAEGILDFDVCGIDEVRGEYLHSVGLSSEIEPEGYKPTAHVSDGIAGKTYRTGESFLFDDIQADNEATPEKRSYRSLISVPIGDHGVFQAVSDEVGGFDEDDLELAELLMRHVEDAIERIEFEGQLRGERDRFAALFENVPDPVVQTRHSDQGAIVEAVNPAFEGVFGYESAGIVGGNLNEFVVPVDQMNEARDIDARGRNGHVVEQEVKRRTTDGLRDFQLTAVPVDSDADEPVTFFVYTDITQRKERQKRVEILNRVLRHDLRNGMNIIKGSAEMLRDAVTDSTAVGYADQVVERADDLLGLAEKTRAVERTLDRDTEATGPVSVTESVETSAARIREEYPNARIDVAVTADVAVRADDMLRTAIYHVMENAVEHNDSETPTVTVRADYAGDRDDMLRLRVADDGPGIPETERELIGEEREITQLRHASGLGLWLVDWVVSQSGGSIAFESNDPRGTVVTLSVPIATEADVIQADD